MHVDPIILYGKFVVLHEIIPDFFHFVVDWRNNPILNRFLNQPFTLSIDSERHWYHNKYLNDDSQGLLILVERSTNTPFGTIGWTDMDLTRRQCIWGRILLGNHLFANSDAFLEALFLASDFLYSHVDHLFCHIAIDNRRSIRLHKRLGFVHNPNPVFPSELLVNGFAQSEFVRSKSDYLSVRHQLFEEVFS